MDQEIELINTLYSKVSEFLIDKSFQIVGAIFILLVGLFMARKVSGLVFTALTKRNVDLTLSHFASGGLRILIIAMVAVMALGKIGVSVSPFVAAIGALSLGAGLALQGLLSNYGAGVAIILTRPFVVGDTVKLLGVAGIVKEVKLSATVLTNEDGVLITIPNKHIIGEIISNSHADSVVELTIGIAYASDPEYACQVISAALEGLEGLSDARTPVIGIQAFADSSINIGVRFWAKTEVYYQVLYRANGCIHRALKTAGIEIPFPQREVLIRQEGGSQARG